MWWVMEELKAPAAMSKNTTREKEEEELKKRKEHCVGSVLVQILSPNLLSLLSLFLFIFPRSLITSPFFLSFLLLFFSPFTLITAVTKERREKMEVNNSTITLSFLEKYVEMQVRALEHLVT